MEKFKTLNNSCARQIIRCACHRKSRAVYVMLYNCRDYFTDDLFVRIHNILIDMCPLTLEVFKSLPNEVQTFYNILWLNTK